MIDELVELVEGGHQIGAHTVDAVLGALEADQDVREVFDDVVWRHRGKQIAPKTVTQKAYVDAIRQRTVMFGIGPAGTGKTYLAMALAVAALQSGGRTHHPHAPRGRGRRALGFLPGDMLAKVDPYLCRCSTRSTTCSTRSSANTYMERGTIEVAPLAFMRGRTLNDSFIILDEAQNMCRSTGDVPHAAGFGPKVVVTGDVTQSPPSLARRSSTARRNSPAPPPRSGTPARPSRCRRSPRSSAPARRRAAAAPR